MSNGTVIYGADFAAGVMPRRSRVQREKEAALRLGLGWVMAIGWPDGPAGPVLMIVAASDGRRAEAVRKEAARLKAALGEYAPAGEPGLVSALCVADGAAARLRRKVVAALDKVAERKPGYDVFKVGVEAFFRCAMETAAAARVRVVCEPERSALIAAEMGRVG